MAVPLLDKDPHNYARGQLSSTGIKFEDIVSIVTARRNFQSPVIKQMIEVRKRYNGDYVVPLPDLEEAPELPPLTPAIIADAIDHTAMRAASVMPAIMCPALDPSKEQGRKSREWAMIRRKFLGSTWHHSRMKLLMRRAYRHLCGYATFSMLVLPDYKNERARIVLRDPLTTYPEPKTAEDYTEHGNVAFVYGKSAAWLRENYPVCRSMIQGEIADSYRIWDCVEWIDDENIVIGIMGPHIESFKDTEALGAIPSRGMMELARYPNRAGMVPAIIPSRVTLDRVASQVAHIVDITDLMAKLLALDIIATQKNIWPDRFIIGRSGTMPQIVGGRWKEGIEGEPNILLDVEQIGALPQGPDQRNQQTIDRLERNARVSSGFVPSMGGETYGSLRTGKGMDSMMDAAVMQRVQELQEIFESHAPELNKGVFSVQQGYFDKKAIFFSGWSGDVGHVEFTPSIHLAETHENVVSYAIPGADVQGVTVALGQLRGAKAISAKTFRTKHPWIDDADAEGQQVLEEDLEEAMRVSILERASQGGIPPDDLAEIEQGVKEGLDIVQAVRRAQERAQARQATAAPPPEDPAQVAPPGAQPGLANPGEGQEQPIPPQIPPPQESQQNMRMMLQALQAGKTAPPTGAPVA